MYIDPMNEGMEKFRDQHAQPDRRIHRQVAHESGDSTTP